MNDLNPIVLPEESLLAYVNERFLCMDGPPQAYFEMACPCPDHEGRARTHRYLYSVVGARAIGPSKEENVKRLITWAQAWFDTVRQATGRSEPVLFWRRKPTIGSEVWPEGGSGETVLTFRLNIPGINLHVGDYGGMPYPDNSELVEV